MAHAQNPDFVFRRNERVQLNRRGRQFSRLLVGEVCVSAVVMLYTPCSEVVWNVLDTHSIYQFPLHFPSRASPCAITFQLDFTIRKLTYFLTYLLTYSWSRTLLEKLIGFQLVKEFPAFYRNKSSLPLLHVPATCPYHEPARCSPCPHPTSWISILILSSNLRLCLPSGIFPTSFPV
jgi:hypothetical protein